MKTLLIAILTLVSTSIFAQHSVVWKGGTPGKENVWNEARNWSNNKVPNEFSDVIIPDVSTSTFSTPIIKDGMIEINSLRIDSNAQLSIETSARLIIYSHAEGLIKENIKNEGTLIVMDELSDVEVEKLVSSKDN